MNSSAVRDRSLHAQEPASLLINNSPSTDSRAPASPSPFTASPPPPPAPQTRVACDACRDRKIGCDRSRPICGRCIKMGIICRFSNRSRSTLSKNDLSQIITTMNERLQHAEAQIATSKLASSPQSFTAPLYADPGSTATIHASNHALSALLEEDMVSATTNPPMHSAISSTKLYSMDMMSAGCMPQSDLQAASHCV